MISNIEKLLILDGNIYGEDTVYEKGYIKIENGMITEMGERSQLTNTEEFKVISLPHGYSVVPGMIDIHIHGVNGADTMDATREALDTMTGTLPKEGTTSFLATTMTEAAGAIEKALKATADYMSDHQKSGQAEILGLHLEGPFINPDKAGAQPLNRIQKPIVEVFKNWHALSGENIKLVTLAPELDDEYELIRYLKENGIVASVGHSSATYDQIGEAIDAGLSHVTHLFNQMSGLHHREPGIVGASFLRKELMVELISDGIHVRPEVVQLAFDQITDERLILITDSMRAKCLKNGQYDLGGQMVTVKDGKALLDEDTLAGSVLKMKDAFTNIQEFTTGDMRSAIKMTAENPARQLNVFDRKGSLAPRKDADIVILDENKDVYTTICKGKIAYIREDDTHETN
ncbi:N-acetylglucosamine-6-phosphate deacetylase [Rossellomorea aquimaris]|uniref:N-acetylglucosamine-6-phosphate deacetylase n=1 Tax=Rossellomorea aquimaris TaxID=189382 RepID=A0A5D4TN15_9BACI|nr:N-acetylglucosamine-6-phosphate deacetylase [Rossellomorea aquimaris]TYS75862.1 N-acetylglucosamine-6-phosphate deacetylase [Rossellomorea aquimaris]TYS81122.1 N-acetylglucosamine-6-phosphate deacetylase [Rossellomorea aquimaris]